MKPCASLALLVALAAAPAAAADSLVSQAMPVDGTVPTRCKISPPTTANLSNSSFASDGTGGQLVLSAIVGSDGMTSGAEATLRFAITCTGAHDLTITSGGGLVNRTTATPVAGFSSRADYTLTANWGATTQSATTAGSSISLDLSQDTARAGNLDIVFALPLGRGPMIAGSYTDEILIQLNAR